MYDIFFHELYMYKSLEKTNLFFENKYAKDL